MVQHMSQTDGGGGGGAVALLNFFLVTIGNGQRPAHSAPIVVIG